MKISIIVPIYKVEKYLRRCVESLLAQSYTDFEIILVDDGSPDRCPSICDEYASHDKRVKVIHKENGGLSDARNHGLACATGEYIAFVDSDDWVAPNYLEILYEGLESTGADICECGVIRTSGEEDIESNKSSIKERASYSTEEGLRLLIEDCVFHQYVWNKLYKRKVIRNILFPKGKTNEDEFWTYRAFGQAKKVTNIVEPLYYYYQRSDSIMGESYSLKRLDALEAKMQRQEYIESQFPGLNKIAKNNLFGSCIYSAQMSLMFLDTEQKIEAKAAINKILKRCGMSFGECLSVGGSNKVWFTLAHMNFWMTCCLKNFLKKGF